jgi:hypothetical protein
MHNRYAIFILAVGIRGPAPGAGADRAGSPTRLHAGAIASDVGPGRDVCRWRKDLCIVQPPVVQKTRTRLALTFAKPFRSYKKSTPRSMFPPSLPVLSVVEGPVRTSSLPWMVARPYFLRLPPLHKPNPSTSSGQGNPPPRFPLQMALAGEKRRAAESSPQIKRLRHSAGGQQ